MHPDFKNNHWIYLSYAVQGSGGYGAEISRAKLDLSNPEQPKLTDLKRIWQQVPKCQGKDIMLIVCYLVLMENFG